MEKLNFFLIHRQQTLNTRQQTQNSEPKNRGVGVEHRGVCVWNVRNKPKTREKTQNSKTNRKLANKQS